MAERYQILKKIKMESVESSCPVVLDSYAILHDTKEDKRIAQLKLQNKGPAPVQSCTVWLLSEDKDLIADHTFEGLNAQTDEFFGSKEPIFLPAGSEDATPVINRINFSDGTSWTLAAQKVPASTVSEPEELPDDALPELDEDKVLTEETTPSESVQQAVNESTAVITSAPVAAAVPAEAADQAYAAVPVVAAPTVPATSAAPAAPAPAPRRKKLWPVFAAVGVIIIGIAVYFLFFWKSAAVKNTEDLISKIGTVTYDSKNALENAENAYNALNGLDKRKVSNSDVLTKAREDYEIAVEAYFKENLATYADDLRIISSACGTVWLADIYTMNTVGAEYINTVRTAIHLFDKDQSYSQYPSSSREYLWVAAIGASPDNITSSYSIKSGKTQQIISDCYHYNQAWTLVGLISNEEKKVNTFISEFSDRYPEETGKLREWMQLIADTGEYLQKPTDSLSVSMDNLSDFLDTMLEMKEYFESK